MLWACLTERRKEFIGGKLQAFWTFSFSVTTRTSVTLFNTLRMYATTDLLLNSVCWTLSCKNTFLLILLTWLLEWQCKSLFVGHFGPDWNISPTIRWIFMIFGTLKYLMYDNIWGYWTHFVLFFVHLVLFFNNACTISILLCTVKAIRICLLQWCHMNVWPIKWPQK